MLGRNSSEPALFQMVDLEALVPANHMLRKIDRVLDLRFVRDLVVECYTVGRGRPSIDPELAVRMMVLGELFDLSDRELCDELGMHAGYRWFCRLNFHDPVPDHSTLSRLRNERWAESGLWERLRDEVLKQCAAAGLISGRHLSLDGTQVEADASMKSLRPIGPQPLEPDDPEDGLEPQPRGNWRGHGKKLKSETHRSVTDPDARLYRKGNGQGAKLSYLAHDLIDTKSRVILRRRASMAHSSAEREIGIDLVDEVIADAVDLGIARPEILTADTGYGTSEFVADVLDRELLPHIPLQASAEMEELPTWMRRTKNLTHLRNRHERLRRAKARNQTRALHRTRGYTVSRKLRVRSEHLIAEGKNEHGLRRARRRGLSRVQPQMELSSTVQNLKRLVAFLGRPRRRAAAAVLEPQSSCNRPSGRVRFTRPTTSRRLSHSRSRFKTVRSRLPRFRRTNVVS